MPDRSMKEDEDEEEEYYQHLISTLPKGKGFMLDTVYHYNNFWYDQPSLRGTLIAQNQHYNNPDILLASHPKTGTTWLKSILFAVHTRTQHQLSSTSHPLLTSNPHDVVPFIEFHAHNHPTNPVPNNTSLLATHIPYNSLPKSIKETTTCRIVYVYRDPKDVVISLWHFANRYRTGSTDAPQLSLTAAVDLFCDGKSMYGPYWDHLLEYRKLNKSSILFVSYEELKSKKTKVDCMMKLAEFVGQPFTETELKTGVLETILDLCSITKLKGLEINRAGSVSASMPDFMKMTNDLFFRKGEVGDHRNHLSDEMIQRIDEITEMKRGI